MKHTFKLGLNFDLSNGSVEFYDCILHSCDTGVVTISIHRENKAR